MAVLDQIQIPNGTTYDLAAKSFYGTCSTAAATATKVVTLSSNSGWNLVAGVIIGVKFSNNNTASSVKLDVNGSGAKSIYFANAVYTGNSVQITGWKDYIIYYMYDGTNWVFLNNSYNYTDNNNYVTQTATTASANYEVLFSNTADNTTRTEGARKSSNLIFNPATGKLVSPVIETGTAASNYFQSQKFRGQGDADTYYHAIDFGYQSHDQMDFYEYGGKYVFHKHTGAAITDGDTIIGTILDTGWNGNVVGNVTGNATTATTATKLGTSTVGGTTTPIYLNSGVPTALGYTLSKSVPSDAKFTDTTYESKAATSGGTDVSLVTTGEKYTWNNKSDLTLGTTATTAAAGNHTHNYAGSNTAGGAATTLLGTYSGAGGQLAPNTVASNSVKAVMMNNPKGLTGFNTYCDCILMDAYGGTDVPVVTGIGLSKKGTSSAPDATPRAYIFNGTKGNTTTWANMAEVVTTKNIKTTSIGSASAGTAIAADDITAWSAGTLPTLGTAIAADDITAWSAGTLPTLGTAIAADDITAWSAGTAPSLTVTSVACDDITAWSAGSLPSLTYNSTNHTLTFAQGSLPSLSYTAKSVGSASGWSAGTVPSLSYTARSIPNVTGVGTLPSLTYTARSIPNVTGVGTLPSLTYTARSIPNISVTATTVATGGVN